MKILAVCALGALTWCSAYGQDTPLLSVSGGYIYLNLGQRGAPRASLNGWYFIPQYHISKSWSAIAEFTNFYGSPQGKSTTIHGFTFGPLYAIATKTRITPFVFAEIGDVRSSVAGMVTNNFAFVGGVGANVALAKHFALQLLPADYVLTTPSGGPLNSYAAQVGIAYSFGHK